MSNETAKHSVPVKCRGLLFVLLLMFCGATICLAWRYHLLRAAIVEEQSCLIDSLVVSISEAGRGQIQVALFDANLDDGSATKELKNILDTESTFAWKAVSSADVQAGDLERFDVVIFPGGSAPEQSKVLGENGKRAVRRVCSGRWRVFRNLWRHFLGNR